MHGAAYLQVALSLFLAAIVNDLTGPAVTTASYFVFPVALAAWRLGLYPGILTALVSSVLSVMTGSLWSSPSFHWTVLLAEGGLRFVGFLVVSVVTYTLSRQQKTLTEQKELLSEQRDELTRMNRGMEEEMRAARSIQKLLFGGLPQHPSLEVAAQSRAARILGGDTFDLSLRDDETLAVMIGDVSGKGSPAALAGAILTGLLDDIPTRYSSPAATVSYLNERLVGYLPPEMFITLFYGLLDLKTGRFSYSSAGHEPPFLVRQSGGVEMLDGEGLPLGILRGATYSEEVREMNVMEMIFLYTDGLEDEKQAGGERLGGGGLERLVKRYALYPCQEALNEILSSICTDDSDSFDDMTAVAVRYLSPASH